MTEESRIGGGANRRGGVEETKSQLTGKRPRKPRCDARSGRRGSKGRGPEESGRQGRDHFELIVKSLRDPRFEAWLHYVSLYPRIQFHVACGPRPAKPRQQRRFPRASWPSSVPETGLLSRGSQQPRLLFWGQNPHSEPHDDPPRKTHRLKPQIRVQAGTFAEAPRPAKVPPRGAPRPRSPRWPGRSGGRGEKPAVRLGSARLLARCGPTTTQDLGRCGAIWKDLRTTRAGRGLAGPGCPRRPGPLRRADPTLPKPQSSGGGRTAGFKLAY